MSSIKYLISELKNYSNLVKQSSNKNMFLTLFDMVICGIKYGASPANYYKFDFYNKDSEHRASFVTNKISSRLIAKYNQKQYVHDFEDKVSFMRKFNDYAKRDFIAYPDCSETEFNNFKNKNPKFIAKPADGSQGQGIYVFNDSLTYSDLKTKLGGDAMLSKLLLRNMTNLMPFITSRLTA